MAVTMPENQIRIRLTHEGLSFVYSIWRAGELIQTAEVHPAGAPVDVPEDAVFTGYYGGSEVMD